MTTVDQDTAQAIVRAYCGWHIAPEQAETLIVDGSGSDVQPLPTLHIAELASVIERGVEVDITAYEWSEIGLLIRYDGQVWTDRVRGLLVSLTHGYEAWPLDVTAVIGDLLASGDSNVQSAQVGGVQVTYATADSLLGTSHRAVLDRYRLPPRP